MTLLTLFSFVFFTFTYSQDVIRFRTLQVGREDNQAYLENFKNYTLASLSAGQTATLLRSRNYFSKLSIEVSDKTYDFALMAHDLRSADYKLRALTETGVVEMPRSTNVTFAGYTSTGHHDVRIASDDHYFHAMIAQDHDILFIEPAKDILSTAPDNTFVIYWASDALKKFEDINCGVKNLHTQILNAEDAAASNDDRLRTCKTVQIALANDHLMFNKYGSVQAVEDHVMGVINDVLTNYDFEFTTDLEFDVTEIFVATNSGNDPFPSSTDPGVLLDAFTSWGPTGFSATHDVASLWSARNFDGNTIGLAWVGTVCTANRYNVLEDFSSNGNLLRVLQAHEMGHNFNAEHDDAGTMFIMSPAVTNTTTWSAASLSVINAFIPTRTCLSSCAPPAPPIADFNGNPTSGCSPLQVTFHDLSLNNPTSWSWSFPGGTPSSSSNQNPIVTYNNPGSFNVTLTATNAQGSNTKTINNYITVNNDPFSDFDYSDNGLTITFSNLSQFATSYLWNFGDGNTSTATNPTHTYAEDGTYLVKLTAFNSCGNDVSQQTLVIITPPFADFSSDITDGCDPMEVQFLNYSSSNSTSFNWTFPGGSPATSTAFQPLVLYETPGTYAVTLVAHNAAGQDVFSISNYITVTAQPHSAFTYSGTGLQITFNSSGSTGTTYLWHFGDGQTSTLANPVHTYAQGGTYTVMLTVNNACGGNTSQQTIVVTGAPIAEFVADQEDGCPVFVVHFTSTSAGNPTSYNWTFEGGVPATSNAANPVVTYNNPGSFDVSLTVMNLSGSNTLTLPDFITVNHPTISDFAYFINGSQATFTNQSSYGLTSAWSFGDGELSTETNPVHVYPNDGNYTVQLISTGICGPDTSSTQIAIHTPPVANFTIQQNGSCIPTTVSYTNTSSNNATSFAWTFEGGSPATSALANPTVTYNTPGTYDVQLIAYSLGGSDTITMANAITVGTVPDAAFLLSTNGMTVNLENQSTDANSYVWLFDDGFSSTEESPSHTYANYGTYELTLIAYNGCGSDTMLVVIELSVVPNAFFGFDTHSGCAPFQVHYIDQSQNSPTSWNWTFEGGDPASSTLQNPVVTYNTPGDYLVSLTVMNAQGSDVLVLDDLVSVAGTPDATFDHNQVQNKVFLQYNGIDYDSLHWSFGDGRTDNSLNPTVEYSVSGQYEIQLIVYNACGSDTSSILVTIEIVATQDPLLNNDHWQLRPNPFNDLLNLYGEPN
ncbi:MAG TPA: PKD domain-containing protein, partial [Saprospiraceae bacterium]|nr:PKD domain-containing protein [Saprospiraceae bacterium]